MGTDVPREGKLHQRCKDAVEGVHPRAICGRCLKVAGKMVREGVEEPKGGVRSDPPQAIGERLLRESPSRQGCKGVANRKRDEQLTEGRDDEEEDERSEANTGADR